MDEPTRTPLDLEGVSAEVLEDLTKRVQDIDNTYRAVAQKMGQLYMRAEEHKVASLATSLDKPMRNASDNEQTFAAILDELRTVANRQ
jgi:hypothetical protein